MTSVHDMTRGPGLLAGLTDAQREATVHDAGPLIVLAGPGTGKTRVIERRLAWAVGERGVEPERALALTFTVKAAEEMRARVRALLGESIAARLQVRTFNGLGWTLLRRFADVLGLPTRVTLIDAVQHRRLIRDVIVDMGLFARARGVGLDTLADELACSFDTMSELALEPGPLASSAAEALRAAEAARDEAGAAIAQRRADEARAYAEVMRRRHERGWLTYDDQVLLACRVLREHADIASIVRGEVRTVVVDEFQDTNPAQIELLRQLVPPREGARADLCVVGDDDQAIYAFRGADEQAFARFARVWEGARVIELAENFRSGAPVVEIANAIVRRAGKRFRPEKTLRKADASAAPDVRATGVTVSQHSCGAEAVAALLRAAEADGAPGFTWDAHAVIAATHLDLDRVADALRLEGIPFEREVRRTRFDDPGVLDVLAWARWLVNPDAGGSVRRLLVRPPTGFALERAANVERAWRRACEDEGPIPLPAFLARAAPREPAIDALVRRYDALRVEVRSLLGSEAIARIVTGIDAAHADLLPGRARARRVLELLDLVRLARDVQQRLEPPADLHATLAYIDELESLRQVSARRPLGDADDVEFLSEAVPGAGRVRLMTAHAAKGLEFDTVYVVRAGSQHGFGKVREREGWTAPRDLFDPLDDRPEKDRARDEQRRLFYVACTRAKRRLVVLANLPQKPSAGLHMYEELVRGAAPALPIDVRGEDEVVEQAVVAGRIVAPPASGASPPADIDARTPLAELAERLAAAERVRAAGALEQVSRPGVSEGELETARGVLGRSAARLAAIAHAASTGEPPAWHAPADADIAGLAARARREASPVPLGAVLRKMEPPLRLSYSMLEQYTRCGRCFYLRYVLGIEPEQRQEAGLGEVAHQALEQHFGRVRAAEADGRPPPGVDDLLALGRAVYRASLPPRTPADPLVLDQLEAQLRHAAALHDAHANILEIERVVRFEYVSAGVAHAMTAKIDRIDQRPDGSYRVIDYKTGVAWKKLLEPKPDDLQFGVYAMALRSLYGEDVRGCCEYWLLGTGERGRIDLGAINHARVRSTIDKAVAGMLAGEFSRTDDCTGDCVLLPD
ncbi:MAG: ATP-dependent DNA helicase [Planctomycetota bacterium]|nr:ATP-dependent DNA helicase [Planctomycetota bacterium]